MRVISESGPKPSWRKSLQYRLLESVNHKAACLYNFLGATVTRWKHRITRPDAIAPIRQLSQSLSRLTSPLPECWQLTYVCVPDTACKSSIHNLREDAPDAMGSLRCLIRLSSVSSIWGYLYHQRSRPVLSILQLESDLAPAEEPQE